MKKFTSGFALTAYFFAYLLVCLKFSGPGYSNEYYVLISVATFLYGIFIAFSIFNHQNRLSKVRELLRTDDANLLSIYRQSSVFGDVIQKQVRDKLDKYLITQIDYKITDDYHESSESFKSLSKLIIDLDPKNDKQTAVYQHMVASVSSSATNRKLIGTLVNERTTILEWTSIISLHFSIAYFIFAFNPGDLVSSIVSSLVTITSAVMIAVLYQLNSLTWQESKWIWRPLHNLFLDLDLIPYYPDFVIERKRAQIKIGEKVRICHYTKPYPDMSGNKIETVTF